LYIPNFSHSPLPGRIPSFLGFEGRKMARDLLLSNILLLWKGRKWEEGISGRKKYERKRFSFS